MMCYVLRMLRTIRFDFMGKYLKCVGVRVNDMRNSVHEMRNEMS